MSVDPAITAALESAIQQDPANPPLRVHLASLLVRGGDPARAREHAQVALSAIPDHAEALAIARDAARALGDSARAESYARLLGTGSGSAPVPAQGPTHAPDVLGEPDDDDIDDDEERPTRSRVTLADVGGLEHVK